jgi:hypothetical protein
VVTAARSLRLIHSQPNKIANLVLRDRLEPSAERVPILSMPEAEHALGHGQKNLLRYIGNVFFCDPGLAAPVVNQRGVHPHQAIPRLLLLRLGPCNETERSRAKSSGNSPVFVATRLFCHASRLSSGHRSKERCTILQLGGRGSCRAAAQESALCQAARAQRELRPPRITLGYLGYHPSSAIQHAVSPKTDSY